MNMFQLAAALSSKKANKVEPDNFEMSKKSGTSSSNISSVDSRSQFFTFDENQPRYKICCGRVHVWRTAKIICILELLGTVALVLTLIVSFFVDIFHDFPISTKEMLIAWCILAVLASVLYFFGMRKLKSALMLPRLIVQVVNMAIDMLVVGYVSSLIATSKNVELVDNEDDDTVVNHVFLVIWIVIFVLQLLFFVILFLAYRFYSQVIKMIVNDSETISAVPHFRVVPIFRKFSEITPTSVVPDVEHHYASFDHNQSRYMVLFKSMHISTATKLVVVLSLIGDLCLITFISCLLALDHHRLYLRIHLLETALVWFFISLITSFLAGIGIFKRRETLLITHIVSLISTAVLFLSAAVISFVNLESGRIDDQDSIQWAIAVVSLFAFITQIYFVYILISTYRYLKDLHVYLTYSS